MKPSSPLCLGFPFTKRYNRGLPPVVWPYPVPGPQATHLDKMNEEGSREAKVQAEEGAGHPPWGSMGAQLR